MRNYFALIEEENGRFGATFPDLPGCVAEADTLDEAFVRAREALALFLDAMAGEGMPIAEPRNFGTLRADTDVHAALKRGAVATLVSLANEPDERERINVMVSKNLLAEIDAAAVASGMTRSAYLERAAFERLQATKTLPAIAPKDDRLAQVLTEMVKNIERGATYEFNAAEGTLRVLASVIAEPQRAPRIGRNPSSGETVHTPRPIRKIHLRGSSKN